MARVSVRGEASVTAQPDIVYLLFTLTASRAAPAEALADVTTRSALLGDVLSAFGIDRPQRLTEGVTVTPKEEYDERGRAQHVGFVASNRLFVRSSNVSRIGDLIVEAVQHAGAHVEGPWWRVAPSNEAWTEARREAVLDARRRAEAYAAALGMQLGAVVEAGEPAVRTGGPYGADRYAPTFAPLQGLEIESGDLGVAAAVDVTFALER